MKISNNATGKLVINGKTLYNTNSLTEFEESEVKVVNEEVYGAAYLYDKTTDTSKKAYVKLQIDKSKFYNLYQDDSLIASKLPNIFDTEQINGVVPANRPPLFSKYKVELLGVGSGIYGGAVGRIWPVVNGQIYSCRGCSGFTSASGSVSQTAFLEPVKVYPTDEAELKTFVTALPTTTNLIPSKVSYSNGAQTGNQTVLPDSVVMDVYTNSKYPNSSYYQPVFALCHSSNTNDSSYYLGETASANKCYITFTVTGVGSDIGNFDCIDGILCMPYMPVYAGRCAKQFRFTIYDIDGTTVKNEYLTPTLSSIKLYYITRDNVIELN